jgi:transposase-like protein
MLQVKTRSGAFSITFPHGYRPITDELLAAEFLEKMRWGSSPACLFCGSTKVKRLIHSKSAEHHRRRMYWRCMECYKRFNVRGETMMEYGRLPLHEWLRLLHLLDKQHTLNGKQIQACCRLSLKSSFYVLRRIRSGVFRAGEAWHRGAITLSRD